MPDLSLRREGHSGLDQVMRALYKRCKAGPMREQDLRDVLQELTGRSWAADISAWVHGKHDLPVAALLQAHGVDCQPDTPQIAQQLGLRVAEGAAGIGIKVVLRGGTAEAAGMMAGDEWIGIEPLQASAESYGWRLHKLDDLPLYAGDAQQVLALVARDSACCACHCSCPSAPQRHPPKAAKTPKAATLTDTVTLAVADVNLANLWLDGR